MAVKRKLAVKTLAKKCQDLRDLENDISNKNVEEKHGVPKNTVSTWLKTKEKLFTVLEKSSNKRKKVRESNYPDIDNVVFKWFLYQTGKSIPIDGTFIIENAMKYVKELGATDFKASDVCLGRWKKRCDFLHLVYISLSIYSFYQQVYKCRFSISMQFSIPVNINLHGTCIPSPSPKFTGFLVTTILHELSSSALRINIVFANLPDFPGGKCPTISFSFLTQTAYLSIGLSGSL